MCATKFTIVLDKVAHPPHPSFPAPAAFFQLQFYLSRVSSHPADGMSTALRLIEISDRVSVAMKGSATDNLVRTNPTLEIYRTFGDINGVDVSTSLAIVSTILLLASRIARETISLTWSPCLGYPPPMT